MDGRRKKLWCGCMHCVGWVGGSNKNYRWSPSNLMLFCLHDVCDELKRQRRKEMKEGDSSSLKSTESVRQTDGHPTPITGWRGINWDQTKMQTKRFGHFQRF